MIWWLGFTLMALTFALVAIDILFIPTALISLLSILSYFSFLLYIYFQVSQLVAIVLSGTFLLIGGVGLYLLFRYKWWRILSNTQNLEKDEAFYETLEQLKGKTAKTISDLRPSGKVILAGKRYDAIAHSAFFIRKGVLVTVSGISSSQLLVKPLTP